MPTNIKKLLLPKTLARAGWQIIEAREDVEGVPYDVTGPKAELHRLLEDVVRGSTATGLRHLTKIPVLMVRGGKP